MRLTRSNWPYVCAEVLLSILMLGLSVQFYHVNLFVSLIAFLAMIFAFGLAIDILLDE